MTITVIMASFLGEYPNAARNRPEKFRRAVNSFLNQTYNDTELIIVSDGCDITNKLYDKYYSEYNNIKLIKLEKQELYSGEVRNSAFKIANGDIITYLDSDDVIGKRHLQVIHDNFDLSKLDWVYYDDYLSLTEDFSKLKIRRVETRYGSIGTSSISHKNPKMFEKFKHLKWMTGYGHDFLFTFKLNSLGGTFKKMEKMPQYIVAHYRNGDF